MVAYGLILSVAAAVAFTAVMVAIANTVGRGSIDAPRRVPRGGTEGTVSPNDVLEIEVREEISELIGETEDDDARAFLRRLLELLDG
jgi:hypothetical protein